jgi:hypothetical protein
VASSTLDLVLWLVVEFGLLLCGCAGLKTQPDSSVPAEVNLQGVWTGQSVNDCSPIQLEPSRCHAVERITFTLLRRHQHSWGFYRCSPGTAPCYNQVDRGEIKYLQFNGRILWFRVMRNDYSSCLFDTIPEAERMRGQFWCFQGDELVERGLFRVDRTY